ncbi:MAG: hypothetical protein OXH70_08000 [Acidobacteria bacterium]|nr:hypothetical protein [Acidobacteriota bacterium]
MKLRIALLSALFLLVAGTAMATPTAGEAPDSGDLALVATWDLGPVAAHDGYALRPEAPVQTAWYFPVPCDAPPFPGPGQPFPLPLPFPNPWPGPTDQCIPIPLPF